LLFQEKKMMHDKIKEKKNKQKKERVVGKK
jgi:hypothetical protein